MMLIQSPIDNKRRRYDDAIGMMMCSKAREEGLQVCINKCQDTGENVISFKPRAGLGGIADEELAHKLRYVEQANPSPRPPAAQDGEWR